MAWRAKILAISMILGVAAVPLALAAGASPAPAPDETKASVPELHEFHSVIYQLWHDAWPAKDTEKMKALLPDVRRGVQALEAAELPGILRDKRAQWQQGIAALQGSLAKYESAAASGDAAALADAVELLHARFEGLIRIVRPATKELDGYHVVLYRVYHYLLPAQDAPGIAEAAEQLTERCRALSEAPAPQWLDDQARSALSEGVRQLCRRTDELAALPADAEWQTRADAVEVVHGQYQAVEGVFDR